MMIDDTEIKAVAAEQAERTVAELKAMFESEIKEGFMPMEQVLVQVQAMVRDLEANLEYFQTIESTQRRLGAGSLESKIEILKQKREQIYDEFFELQNLINRALKQQIIMTYVHVDEQGRRTIKIFDNTIENLAAGKNERFVGEYKLGEWAALSYKVSQQTGTTLLNALASQKDGNKGLDDTAIEVESRYHKYKGRILWKYNDEWYGYKLHNTGPINEAYVNFYIRDIQLLGDLQKRINDFMATPGLGVISADNANGFLIGDTSLGGLQFAVKGAGGGPQGYTDVLDALKQVTDLSSFEAFKTRFTETEREEATSLAKQMSQRSIEAMVRYHGDKLLQETEFTKSGVTIRTTY